MVGTNLFTDKWTAMEWTARAARRSDLVALAKDPKGFRIISAARITTDAIDSLHNYDTIIILVRGVMSKCSLDVGEISFFREQLREAFRPMN